MGFINFYSIYNRLEYSQLMDKLFKFMNYKLLKQSFEIGLNKKLSSQKYLFRNININN